MPGETLALLGESGSGKSVTLKTLLRLLPQKRTDLSGDIRLTGPTSRPCRGGRCGPIAGRRVDGVPGPRPGAGPGLYRGPADRRDGDAPQGPVPENAMDVALDMLHRVRIPSPKRRLANYPHELSGGMRQRVMIALALACRPRLLLADEPTTALDATVQIQILLLLRELQREFGMGVIFVTHDIGVAVEVSERIAVAYAGQIVEEGTTRDVIRNPRHPYTQGCWPRTCMTWHAARGWTRSPVPSVAGGAAGQLFLCAPLSDGAAGLPTGVAARPDARPRRRVACLRAGETLAAE
ncbi:ATP-binding cassette domain-containing protein [Paracoccus marcusii]|uniref:ATP-binding cassette domain-containing protein n=1 Tax=Paracoccus marcusii TaxID=59779 RepID=UPI002ED0C295|nr:ATP-binding cassette domain-containing protein [Paracoccus marcusii]